jgi:hypothetical protein
MKNYILSLGLLFTVITVSEAQIEPRSINDYLDAYIGTNAKPYIQPLSDMVTTNIHTGVWDWSSIPDKPYFRIKAIGMLSKPSESMRTFEGHTSGDFTPPQTVTAPTIIGDRESIVLHGSDTSVYIFPGGFNLHQIALGTPQLVIGGLYHTEFMGRFLSFPISEKEGNVDFYGIGVRHSISSYFDHPSFDLSVGYAYHHIKAGSYLKSSQHLYSVIVGKSNGILSGHVSLNYQTAMQHLHYTYEDGMDMYNVNLDMENSRPFFVEGGVGLKLAFIFLNGSISYAGFYSFAIGAGLSF